MDIKTSTVCVNMVLYSQWNRLDKRRTFKTHVVSDYHDRIKTDFWMILNEDEKTHQKTVSKIPITPDTKGPKTIAILLILGLLIGFMAYQDYDYSRLEDIPDSVLNNCLRRPIVSRRREYNP